MAKVAETATRARVNGLRTVIHFVLIFPFPPNAYSEAEFSTPVLVSTQF